MGVVGVATYGSLCDGDMWGESGRVGCVMYLRFARQYIGRV